MSVTFDISEESIAVISALISILAMFISLSQARSASKSYKLAKRIYKEGEPNFTFEDISNSCAITVPNEQIILLKFEIFITNNSDKPMIIKDIRLRVVGEEREVILKPFVNEQSVFCGYNISGNNALKKWVIFKIERNLYENLKIIKYAITIQDTNENIEEKSVIIVKEETADYAQTI